jgi:hypothetical protein
MKRKLPLYAERALGELQATRGYTVTEFEKQFRSEHSVSCKPGCANCCHYPLLITIAEGILLFRFLAGKGRLTATLREKLREHGKMTTFLDPAVWMRSNIPCPLLDEKNQCRGYEARPLSCRLLLSGGDPADCHPQAFAPHEMAATRQLSQATSAFENSLLKKNGISPIRVPVGRALLLAEKVLAGEFNLNAIERVLYQEYTAT